MRCTSGLHEWIDPDAAGRCCNGWKRVLYTAPDHLGRCDPVVNPAGVTYGFAWECQTLQDWAESEGLRYRLGAPTVLRCVGLERGGGRRVAVLKSYAPDWPPRCVLVPEGVVLNDDDAGVFVAGGQKRDVES
jgi:hypothetical protein